MCADDDDADVSHVTQPSSLNWWPPLPKGRPIREKPTSCLISANCEFLTEQFSYLKFKI